MCVPTIFYGFIIFAAAWQSAHSIRLTRLEVPQYADPRVRTQLLCAWDLAGETLQSVKWFWNGDPFYEVRPKDASYIPHQVRGLHDQRCECDLSLSQCIVTISVWPELGSAEYTCEVSGERPWFKTVKANRTMAVLAMPSSGPQITGLPPTVLPNTDIHLNCSTQPSLPTSKITWLVNDQVVKSGEHIQGYSDGLHSTWSSIVLSISPDEAKQVECRTEQLGYDRVLSLMKRTLILSEHPVSGVEVVETNRGSTTRSITVCLIFSAVLYRLNR